MSTLQIVGVAFYMCGHAVRGWPNWGPNAAVLGSGMMFVGGICFLVGGWVLE